MKCRWEMSRIAVSCDSAVFYLEALEKLMVTIPPEGVLLRFKVPVWAFITCAANHKPSP